MEGDTSQQNAQTYINGVITAHQDRLFATLPTTSIGIGFVNNGGATEYVIRIHLSGPVDEIQLEKMIDGFPVEYDFNPDPTIALSL